MGPKLIRTATWFPEGSGKHQGVGLEVRDLAFAYAEQPVFADTSLSLADGRYACLLGPSGSGKSTLLYVIAGFLRPSAGSVSIGGRAVADATTFVPPNARGLGMVFQDYSLWPHLTARENVAFALRARGLPDAAATALRLLERMGLDGLAYRRPDELSGGQKQRVALARALAAAPAIVLLDEPLSALDAMVRDELRAYLAQLSRDFGLTALHVTHDPQEALALADVVGVMLGGRIVQWDTPEAVYRRPNDARVARISGPASIVAVSNATLRDGVAEIAFGGRTVVVPAHPDLRANIMAALILRPDALATCDATNDDAIAGNARDSRFAGEHYVVDVILGDGSEVAVTSHVPLHGEVKLTLRSDHAWLAPRGESGS
jgi:ABC-type Fe3+/spermidine/putrescine transport system ATPase subunit